MTGSNIYSDASDLLEFEELTMYIRETKKSIYLTPVFLNLAYIVNSSNSSRSEASEYIFDPVIAVILDPIMFNGIVHLSFLHRLYQLTGALYRCVQNGFQL
jgi:hypothetical protein